MKALIVLACIATYISLIGWAILHGGSIPFAEQWPLYEALRTTASIIFAVVGAWLAVIYPERLKFAFRTEKKSLPTGDKKSNMGRLLSPAINSTAILCIVLLVGVVAPLLRQTHLFENWHMEMRTLSYCLLITLTFWQLVTIFLTLIPADQIKTESDKEELKQATLLDYTRNTQKE